MYKFSYGWTDKLSRRGAPLIIFSNQKSHNTDLNFSHSLIDMTFLTVFTSMHALNRVKLELIYNFYFYKSSIEKGFFLYNFKFKITLGKKEISISNQSASILNIGFIWLQGRGILNINFWLLFNDFLINEPFIKRKRIEKDILFIHTDINPIPIQWMFW